eukprot:1157759-Pelagomonas_calceolata.AAC.2
MAYSKTSKAPGLALFEFESNNGAVPLGVPAIGNSQCKTAAIDCHCILAVLQHISCIPWLFAARNTPQNR